ncbi:hypothetical protein BX600DRAFT_157418 [Xylariales sp. PMI_506]|nr:hypothetical protein BX600DRAFT_157418 [Xylariales sp. PMI_506]
MTSSAYITPSASPYHTETDCTSDSPDDRGANEHTKPRNVIFSSPPLRSSPPSLLLDKQKASVLVSVGEGLETEPPQHSTHEIDDDDDSGDKKSGLSASDLKSSLGLSNRRCGSLLLAQNKSCGNWIPKSHRDEIDLKIEVLRHLAQSCPELAVELENLFGLVACTRHRSDAAKTSRLKV